MDSQSQKQIFDDWLYQHKGLLFKVVRAYAFAREDQDDLFQEIALQVWDSIPSYRGDSKTTTWIYRVALYTAMSWTKRERKHRQRKLALGGELDALIQSSAPQNSRLDWLYDQIAQLNEIDRSLTLLMLDGFSYKEIAATLGISESNVGVKLNRVKKHLASKSEKRCRDGL